MKHLILLVGVILFSTNILAQNTFPTTGKTGVGTDSPTEALEVNGNVRIDSSLIVQDSLLVQNRMHAMELVIDGDSEMKSNARVDLDFRVEGETNLNGQVQMQNLGDIPPSATLKVVVSTTSGQLRTIDFGPLLSEYGLPDEISTCPPGSVPKWLSGVDKLFVNCPATNVGIGTADPLYKLHVVGKTYTHSLKVGHQSATEDALINGFSLNDSQDLLKLGHKVGGLDEVIQLTLTNDGTLTLNSEGSKALVVNDAAGEKILQLEQDGLLRTRKIRVDLNSWADYVFDESYKLMSIDEVREYVSEHKHLPGVPSEAEVREQGLDIGRMQEIQMEKIEELYLHLIDLNEKMDQMQKELDELKAENESLKSNSK
ncbi:MAG: hypothetical protein MI810_03435 [Flavobacteriales bacterium]|nr:hypothetical protein [Flavobacteriales bacterium]